MSTRTTFSHTLVALAVALDAGAAAAAPDPALFAAANSAQPAVIDTLKSLVLIEVGKQ